MEDRRSALNSIYLLPKKMGEMFYFYFLPEWDLKHFFEIILDREVTKIVQRFSVSHLPRLPQNIIILLHLLYTSLSSYTTHACTDFVFVKQLSINC